MDGEGEKVIGDRIKTTRKARKMSMEDLAVQTGFAKSYISSIERGVQSNPSVHFVESVALELGVSVHYLIQGTAEEANGFLDEGWISLVTEAINSGLSKQEFREYIKYKEL
ncbi:helix-turn-helix domain-containing protein [Halobacillus seohaensis]|uniref:Helix-turn-helix domain-containing protein n=1 Tax=Halobacillus seohaensis TaxID=447421 RepID=A0ABW2EIR8_9BACI